MDYIAWSREYSDCAEALQGTIDKLKGRRAECSAADLLELEEKIRKYVVIRNEIREIAQILLKRAAS